MIWYIAAAVMTPGPFLVFLTMLAFWFMIGSAAANFDREED